MNQNVLQYYILGGTIWRRRRRRQLAAAIRAEEIRRKSESVALLRDALRGEPEGTVSKRRILEESADADLLETPRRPRT